jgi:coenzyme F420-0:L-glutamate ligase/coenzyme F420-1:gamma-L-glutamate ligase
VNSLELLPISGIPEVRPGDDLGALVADAALASIGFEDGDVVVVTQKVVSKAENALVAIDANDPNAHRALVAGQSRRNLRRRGDLVISETQHGFVCATQASTCRTWKLEPPPSCPRIPIVRPAAYATCSCTAMASPAA